MDLNGVFIGIDHALVANVQAVLAALQLLNEKLVLLGRASLDHQALLKLTHQRGLA